MNRGTFAALLLLGCLPAAAQRKDDITGVISTQGRPKIAVPDLPAAGDAGALMKAFNDTLWSDLATSGALKMVEKNYYPTIVPRQPSDFKRGGAWLTDWSGPPTSADNLAFGFAEAQNGQFVAHGWLYNLSQPDTASAQVIQNIYFGSLDANGAKKAAHDFAADILKFFGVKSLEGSKIYFVSDRTGHKEIWSMDFDGSNQRPVTRYATDTKEPSISPDGKWLAYVTLVKRPGAIIESWDIVVQSTLTGEKAHFTNPNAPTNMTPELTSKDVLFASSLDRSIQIYAAAMNGSNPHQLSHSKTDDLSPRVNPKNGNDVLFISDRTGKQQLWHMSIDGGGAEMLTSGAGEVANPCWSPDGQFIAFAWTKGYEIGGFNIFLMTVADRKILQLTHDSGVNENPWFAPDGLHMVYTSKRGNSTEVYTMTLDGENVRKLTSAGNNMQPVWAPAIQ